MSVIHVDPDDADTRLEFSRTRLLRAAPDCSAARLLDHRQIVAAIGFVVVAVVGLALFPRDTIIVAVALCTVVYLATVVHRVTVTALSRRDGSVLRVSDADARAVPDADLPIYTVLVPLFREPEVVGALLTHLRSIEYPADRLDVKLLLEADDRETVDAALAHPLADTVDLVLVPAGEPRTKPKALNYGLTLATGDFVTIYDAEDQPDPLQLRRAVVAFGRVADDVACLQAELTYRNSDQNIITRWFTIEYLMWFTLFLPGLATTDAPIPLGGTSNHMRRNALEGLGGWDPYNVTEDADLGVRLHRVGWRCAVLGSQTWEEANSDFVNWMKQRSRWYKGYLQTWLVHMRHPVRLRRELGSNGFWQFNLFVGGTPILAMLNPVFWALTVAWFLGHFHFIQEVFPAPIYYAGLSCWALGNLAVGYITVLAARRTNRLGLIVAACLVPLYWLMMSLSAIKAALQLVVAPSFWEKTTHGLDLAGAGGPPTAVAGGAAAAALGVVEVVHAGVHEPAAWDAPAITAAAGRARSRPGQLLATARVLRTVGLVVALLVAWLIFGTALVAHQRAHDLADHGLVAADAPLQPGAAIARLHLAAAGVDATVVEGAGPSQVAGAPGHVVGSALPGALGNAVIVAHRRLWGGPFRDLGRVRVGDPITLDTPWGRARYVVSRTGRLRGSAIALVTGSRPELTLVTDAGGGGRRQVVVADLVSAPLAGAPQPQSGYPAIPSLAVGQLLIAVAWAALGAAALASRQLVVRLWGSTLGLAVAAPVVVVAIAGSFLAVAHAFPPIS